VVDFFERYASDGAVLWVGFVSITFEESRKYADNLYECSRGGFVDASVA